MEKRRVKFIFLEEVIINDEFKTKGIKRIQLLELNVRLSTGDIILIDDVLYTVVNLTISLDLEIEEAVTAVVLEETNITELQNSKYTNTIKSLTEEQLWDK